MLFPKNNKIFLIIVVSLLLVLGCTTQKNTPVTRTYHNVTSKYNYYFNANESYKNSIQRVEKNYNFNYTFPLPVTLLGEKQIASQVGGDMDRAVTKCTDLIRLHSITVKPERKRGTLSAKERKFYNQNEFVQWVREGWLLIGKARVWKGELDEARMTFEHILVQFPETPMWYESHIWIAKIEILKGDFVAAEDRLRNMSANSRYPQDKHFTHLLESTWADFYHKQGKLHSNLKHLEKARDNAPYKTLRIRYTYLLAQMLQQKGELAKSNRYFRRVIRMSPSYEMSFNARINIASNIRDDASGQGMSRELHKMARDEKNAEYLDQIYYALGNIERAKGNMDKAIEYYQTSAQESVSNNHQKGLSYLVLADFFFEKPNYTVSQAYYDSAYRALDQDFPGYNELEIKAQNLNKLVENLNIAAHQDSLLRVAAMSSRERDAIIAELIKQVREEEERLRREEQEARDRFAHFQQTQRGRTRDAGQGGSWYFYNQASLSQGLSEFHMRWGRRKLEDNWRRSNKREVIDPTTTLAEDATGEDGEPQKVLDNKSREYYLQDLPMTDSLKEIAHKKIQEALFRVGEVYENQLKDYPEAIKAYENLAKRYPQSNFTLMGYYNLYQISRFNNNTEAKERYKQQIINNFPSSPYAMMLSDPDYIANMQKKEDEREQFYQQTFANFSSGNFNQAQQMAKEGMEKYQDTKLLPKFHFIYAQTIGKTSSLRNYKAELAEVVNGYPNTDISSTARDIITIIEQRELQFATTQDVEDIEDKDEVVVSTVGYEEPEGEHLFVSVIPKNAPLNQLRFNLVSFNVDHYLNLNLNVVNRELTEYVELLTVEPFEDKDEAMEYFEKATQEQGLMGNLDSGEYTMIIISRKNFELFLEDKSVAEYLNFFRTNYLN